MKIGKVDITKRESLASIVIVAVMLSIGFMISYTIQSNISESNEMYMKALKIYDQDIFDYSYNTGIGNVFANVTVKAVDPQYVYDLREKYMYIERVHEHYTMHERTIVETHGSGKHTYTTTRIEYYWTWDYNGSEEYKSKYVLLNNIKIDGSRISGYPTQSHIDLSKENISKSVFQIINCYVYEGLSDRYYYDVVPLYYTGASFVNLSPGIINNGNTISISSGINADELYNRTISDASSRILLFWIIWSLAIILAVAYFVFLNNDWLNK
jgi:hypothetical protein